MNKSLVLVGATASGKSDVAIALANNSLETEIISLDSMQIYKGMEIGTGVVPVLDRKGISHHMTSMVDPKNEYNVKEFQSDVYSILESKIESKFILVGGTGLYTHAVVDGYAFAPSSSSARQSIIDDYGLDEKNPNETNVQVAYAKLKEVDGEAAEKIDPKNVRRIIRALEAVEVSGKLFSSSGDGVQTFGKPKIDVEIIGLRYSREVLRARIVARIEQMLSNGWIDEVKMLLPIWTEMVAPAQNAIGYIQIHDWINRGEKRSELPELRELIINKTAQFSRRQRKWFERDPRITWIECDNIGMDKIIEIASKKADFL